MKSILMLLVLTFSLQSCIFIAGAAAGAAGIAVVYDHRKLKDIADDQHISQMLFEKIKATPELDNDSTHIAVTCFNRVVLLTGQTITPALRNRANELAQHVNGVKRVYNYISVKGPSSSLTRASDSWITAKIKTQMLATKNLQSGSIKVITENGTVYLMGIVNQNQATTATEIARQVDGVQKVIRIFQYQN